MFRSSIHVLPRSNIKIFTFTLGSRPVNYTVECSSLPGYLSSCECDRNKGYCGVDPCHCDGDGKKTCPIGLYLKQDCGCSLVEDLITPRYIFYLYMNLLLEK